MENPTMIYTLDATQGIAHEDYFYKIVDSSEVSDFTKKGWVRNPAKLVRNKRGPKPKVKDDEHRNEDSPERA